MLKLGLIGCGKMGGALLRGVEKALGKADLLVALSDVVPEAVSALQASLSCPVITGTPAEVAAASDVILLAVKPADMQALCTSLSKVEGSRLYLSIAAGLKVAALESWLGSAQRVIRSMPNTPALVGTGAAAFRVAVLPRLMMHHWPRRSSALSAPQMRFLKSFWMPSPASAAAGQPTFIP